MPGQDKEIIQLCFLSLLLGFKAYSSGPACIVNMVTQPHNHKQPDEFRINPFDNDIPYDWAKLSHKEDEFMEFTESLEFVELE